MSSTNKNRLRQMFASAREDLSAAVDQGNTDQEALQCALAQLLGIYAKYSEACGAYEKHLRYWDEVEKLARLSKEHTRIHESCLEMRDDVREHLGVHQS